MRIVVFLGSIDKHSWMPLQHTWNENIGQEMIHAIRDIDKEEIAREYIDDPYETRRPRIKSLFVFDNPVVSEICHK